MMVLPLVEKGSLADLIAAGVVIKGIEYAWIVCSGVPVCKAMSSLLLVKATGIGRALVYLHLRKPPIYHGDIHLVKHKS